MDPTQAADAQRQWAALPLKHRLTILARARSILAESTADLLTEAGGLSSKTPLEVLSSEVMPTLAAMRFLETSAEDILKTRKPGGRGLPLWMRGVHSEVQRVPLGRVLVIGPSNYPLFLPAVQTVQALVAGNAVIWKPGAGGSTVAHTFAAMLYAAGLPSGLLTVTGESVEAAQDAIRSGVDKVFLTGSANSGRALLRQLADRLVPAVVELSGCDAVIVLPGADLTRIVRALTFGIRLNGSCTCMAPRRVLLVGAIPQQKQQLTTDLLAAFAAVHPVQLPTATQQRLQSLLHEAEAAGATVHADFGPGGVRPVLIDRGQPGMAIAQEDIFAPVATLIDLPDLESVLRAQQQCPLGLTASIFGPEAQCRALAAQLEVGAVFINDLIFPSADPRVPFGGRRLSGFGVTQGAEGLLEMTAIRTVSVQRSNKLSHYGSVKAAQAGLLTAVIHAMYARGFQSRMRGIVQTFREGRNLRRNHGA